MAPKKANASSKAATSGKRKVVCTTTEFKKELIVKYKEGICVSDLVKKRKEHPVAESPKRERLERERTLEAKLPEVFMPSKQ